MQSSAEQEKKLRERLAEERKWAAQEAERTEGMGLQKLAQKVGTSQQNVKNILTRVPKYSKYVAPIDDVLKSVVPEYGPRIAMIVDEFKPKNALVETGQLLITQGRILMNEGLTRKHREELMVGFSKTLAQIVKAHQRLSK